jgi:FAD:protein FMN transferase
VLVPAGTSLDLGATGKAFASDLVTSAIAGRLGVACVLSLGGDVAVGRPEPDAGDGPVPWQVTISETPDEPPTATVTLPTGGLATSTVLARRWHRGGQVVHHLLDPATGRPVDPVWRTASVVAPTCLEANTASTASIVMGARATDWLAERGRAARLVGNDGVLTYVGDWAEEIA